MTKDEQTIDRLLQEVRQAQSVIDGLCLELYAHDDLQKLSLKGAVAYLVRQKKLLDELKNYVKRTGHKEPADVLLEIEKLLENTE